MAAFPSVQLLKQLFDYEPKAGILTWRARPRSMFAEDLHMLAWNGKMAGRPAGYMDASTGYLRSRISRSMYYNHRIIMAIVCGEWPSDLVDHINGVRGDNRLENLRIVTPAENCCNSAVPKNNTSGEMGVTWSKSDEMWLAQIGFGGKNNYLGLFPTIKAAAAARRAAEKRFGFHKNHGRSSV